MFIKIGRQLSKNAFWGVYQKRVILLRIYPMCVAYMFMKIVLWVYKNVFDENFEKSDCKEGVTWL